MAVLGVDGCPVGWFAVRLEGDDWQVGVYPDIATLWVNKRECELILIDIPIGLPSNGQPIRSCDREARRLLGRPRASSVFPPPSRAALNAVAHQCASDANEDEIGVRLSIQTWAIIPKIREVDEFLTANAPARAIVRECHPELCFWGLNGQMSVAQSKKTAQGRETRREILRATHPIADAIFNYARDQYRRNAVADDDIIDAIAAAFTAMRGPGSRFTLPDLPEQEIDGRGLPMEMVYPN